MAGFRATQIRKPANETEFEQNCVVLFAAELSDPNVKRVGTRGQAQDGVDLVGYRDNNPNQLVGVQCKLKSTASKLAASEVKEEVQKALKYDPPLREFITVTTAPDDTKLDQLAQKLTLEQQALGRSIIIQVWGWSTLQDKINRYPTAKEAFDPGFSPALRAHNKKLAGVIAGSERILAKIDLISTHLEEVVAEKLPPNFADRELQVSLGRTLKRRSFVGSDTAGELGSLAARAIDGDLARAASALRAEVCRRAAQANALADTLNDARRFRDSAAGFEPSLDLSVLDALLVEAGGGASAALRTLKARSDPDARTAVFSILLRRDRSEALRWIDGEGLRPTDLTAVGALNLVIARIESKALGLALACVQEAPEFFFDECPALLLLRAQLTLTSLVPDEQKGILLQGLPLNPAMIALAGGASSQAVLQSARSDINALISQLPDLGLLDLCDFLSEVSLWLGLEIAATSQDARAQLAREIGNPKLTLRRVRLGLAYDVSFNREALARHLARQKELGGWTSDERLAALLLATDSGDAPTICEFFKTHHDDLFSQTELSRESLALTHIQALAQNGACEDARRWISTYRRDGDGVLNLETADFIERFVEGLERGSEAELLRQRYEETRALSDLRPLIGMLHARRDTRQLATYAPVLVRLTKAQGDFALAIRAVAAEGEPENVLALIDEHPELSEGNDDYAEIRGWSLLRLGRVVEARAIARSLAPRVSTASARELLISTTVETGDWGYLQSILANEASRLEQHAPGDLIRLAKLAMEAGSPYVEAFRDAALAAAPDDPHVNLAAYTLAVERGQEDADERVQLWFHKAVEGSGGKGPVQRVSLRELIDQTPDWNAHSDTIQDAIQRADMPLFVGAKAVRRQLIDFTIGQALHNAESEDSIQWPIFAFPGSRPVRDLSGVKSVAFDPTALLTLEFLGVLDAALDAFEAPLIAPSTLSAMFVERQFLRGQQPSQVAKAERIQALIVAGRLKIADPPPPTPAGIQRDIGPELASLIALAERDGGVVVHSAPVTRLGSYLEESVDMTVYEPVLSDTLSVLSFVRQVGRIDASTHERASSYLRVVDIGWERSAPLQPSSVVRLDDLTVTYLDYVGLLDPLTRSVAEVQVHPDLHQRVQSTIRHSRHTSEVLTLLERMRFSLAQRLNSGRLHYCPRRPSDKNADPTVEIAWPTMDILSNLDEIDAVIADDRCLNQHPTWEDPQKHVAASASTLDVLSHLRTIGALDDAGFWRVRHKLRKAGYFAIPIEPEELQFQLAAAPINGNAISETPELKALRTSITLPLIRRCLLPSDESWLTAARFAVWRSLRQLWSTGSAGLATIARATWLLSVMPDPIEWCLHPEDDKCWILARQQTAHLIATLLMSLEADDVLAGFYGTWLEHTVLPEVKERRPEMLARAVAFLGEYLPELVKKADGELGEGVQRLLSASILNALPAEIRSSLIMDEGFRQTMNLNSTFYLPIDAEIAVETKSLHNALRRAVAGDTAVTIELRGGERLPVSLGQLPGGQATITLDQRQLLFNDADLLAADIATSASAIDRVLSARPLLPREEDHWRSLIGAAPLRDWDYTQLMTDLSATPEAHCLELRRAETFDPEVLLPDESAYYERLIGPISEAGDLVSHIDTALVTHWEEMLRRHSVVALRRLAFSGLWRPLIPFENLRAVSAEDLRLLLSAKDPFSLLFGFELCAARIASEPRIVELGQKFLDRILPQSEGMAASCMIFSAAAVITGARLRYVVPLADMPLWWTRMAALAHAGVIADALSEQVDADNFFAWATENQYALYLWHTVADRREAPRWRPDWLAPDHIQAEVVGRVHGALLAIPDASRPAEWVSAIQHAVVDLGNRGRGLAPFFPGPFDDFAVGTSPPLDDGVFADALRNVEVAPRFYLTPGIHHLAYLAPVNGVLIAKFLRLVALPAAEAAKAEDTLGVLRLCAHVAVAGRSSELADATINRCLVTIRENCGIGASALFLVMIEACAAHRDRHVYGEAVEKAATAFAFSITEAGDFEELADILDSLSVRDERLTPKLAPARSIVRIRRARGFAGK